MLADRPRLRAALTWLVPAVVFLVVILAVFWRLWTGIDGAPRAFAWDAQWEYWGDLQFLHDALADGELPLWNPYDRGGYPLHADPQAGVLYPVNWLLVGLSFLTGPAWWLVTIKIVLHFWLAGFGMYTFLRRRRLPEAACYAGGVFFILCYPFSHAMFSALNWGMAWLPWMLLAVDGWAERPTRGRGAGVALAFGLSQLAGAPAAFWYSLLVVVPYGGWAIVHHARASGDARGYLREAASVSTALAAGLFVAMVAAQFLATSELVTHTVRDARDLEFIGASVFNAEEIIAFAIPRMPVPNEGPFLTIVMLFAVAAVLSVEPTPRRLVLAGVAVAGVLLAFGNQAGFLPASASMVPPFGFFRRAHRYFYVCVAPIAILGAEGLALLARQHGAEVGKRYGRVLLIGGAIGVVIFGCGFTIKAQGGKAAEDMREAFGLACISFAVSAWALYMLVTRSDARWKQAFLIVAALVVWLNLWFARSPVVEKNFWAIPRPTRDAEVAKLEGVPLAWRVYDRELLKFRPGIRLGIRDLGGYEGDPLALARYAQMLKMGQQSPALLGHANVRYLLEDQKTSTKPVMLGKGGLTQHGPGIYEIPQVAPAVMWIDSAQIVSGGPEAVLMALRAATPGQVALLEAGDLGAGKQPSGLLEGSAAPVAGRIVSYGRSRLRAEIEAPDEGVVVIHEGYYPGWRARVDGQVEEIRPVNGQWRGLIVRPGKHVIEMDYPATQYRWLALLSLAGLGAAVALLVLERRREARA